MLYKHNISKISPRITRRNPQSRNQLVYEPLDMEIFNLKRNSFRNVYRTFLTSFIREKLCGDQIS